MENGKATRSSIAPANVTLEEQVSGRFSEVTISAELVEKIGKLLNEHEQGLARGKGNPFTFLKPVSRRALAVPTSLPFRALNGRRYTTIRKATLTNTAKDATLTTRPIAQIFSTASRRCSATRWQLLS